MRISDLFYFLEWNWNYYSKLVYNWFKVNIFNEYGEVLSFVFLFIVFIITSRLSSTKYAIFKKPEDVTFPAWVNKILSTKNVKVGLSNLLIGIAFLSVSILGESGFAEIIGVIAIGIGVSFLTYNFLSDYVMPGTKKFLTSKNGKYVFINALIMSWIAYYFFVDYFQLNWKSLKQDPDIEGPIRYVFYYTGIAMWKFMMPLMLLHLGRNKINVLNVILLIGFSWWFVYDFFDYLTKGAKQIDGSVFLFIATYCIFTFGIWHRREEKKRWAELKNQIQNSSIKIHENSINGLRG